METTRTALRPIGVTSPSSLRRLQQSVRRNIQRVGEALDQREGKIAGAVFDDADIGLVDARFEGERFLRQGAPAPLPPDIAADRLPDVHGGTEGGPGAVCPENIFEVDDYSQHFSHRARFSARAMPSVYGLFHLVIGERPILKPVGGREFREQPRPGQRRGDRHGSAEKDRADGA